MRRPPCWIALLVLAAPATLHACLIDDLVNLKTLIEGRCGPRFHVVWVDDSGVTPPCLLSYSFGCEEIQTVDVAACALLPRQPGDLQSATTSG
ncbi:MAG TPA: hypothetical protein VLC08_08585 [Chitinolyticbacter sp.]|nr:hypothetical protein [Chitinolyticbacter sp.]